MRKFNPLLILFTLVLCWTTQARERWLFLGDSITQAGHYTDYIETWMLLNEADCPEIINLGLSSETVSGLSEPGHPFPRPYLHNRLDRVLERTKPDVIIACYGMNCGIYHPFSDERFKAYQDGINQLLAAAQDIDAEVILITPPPFAGRVKPKAPPTGNQQFGYKHPASDYNDVLQAYADWILSLDEKDGIRAFNIRPPIEKYMEKCYPKEPVHPNPFGHQLVAEAFLQSLEKDTGSDLLKTGINKRADDPRWKQVMQLVKSQRLMYDRALLNDIGHGNPSVMKKKTEPMDQAEIMTKDVDDKLAELVKKP